MMKNIEQTIFHIADGDLMEAKKYTDPVYAEIYENPVRIGVIGYSKQEFNRGYAEMDMFLALHNIKYTYQTNLQKKIKVELVSGLTDMGIPGIAYRYVKSVFEPEMVKTVGVACSKAKDYPQFPVDEKHIIGDEWGDESDYFLNNIDCLIRIGGGEQSMREVATFKSRYPEKLVLEYDL